MSKPPFHGGDQLASGYPSRDGMVHHTVGMDTVDVVIGDASKDLSFNSNVSIWSHSPKQITGVKRERWGNAPLKDFG